LTKKPINYIATLASLERSTVLRRLPDLVRLGLVVVEQQRIEGSKSLGFSRYALVALSNKVVAPSHNLVAAEGGSVGPRAATVSKEPKNGSSGQAGHPLDFSAVRKEVLDAN